MKIAIIGYGKMGKAIEKILLERGHTVVAIIDVDSSDTFHSAAFRNADAAIEFSAPIAAYANIKACFTANVPVVVGTTGWTDRLDEVRLACQTEGKTLFYASNYSIGVNLFATVNRYLAKLMNEFPEYDVHLSETHHIHKLDAPSGTALSLADDIIELLDRKKRWKLRQTGNMEDLLIEAVREGEVPGIHEIIYESEIDSIRLLHSAKSRIGFALGAVLAAEFIVGKKGFLGMKDMMSSLFNL
jgi:4-hydroxy-tetrahydrodipicolinate reductase